MEAVVRTYSGKGAKELFDVLEKHKKDVESLMRSVTGFSGYSLIRTGDGGISVTACRDKAGLQRKRPKSKGLDQQECFRRWRQPAEGIGRIGHSSASLKAFESLEQGRIH